MQNVLEMSHVNWRVCGPETFRVQWTYLAFRHSCFIFNQQSNWYSPNENCVAWISLEMQTLNTKISLIGTFFTICPIWQVVPPLIFLPRSTLRLLGRRTEFRLLDLWFKPSALTLRSRESQASQADDLWCPKPLHGQTCCIFATQSMQDLLEEGVTFRR